MPRRLLAMIVLVSCGKSASTTSPQPPATGDDRAQGIAIEAREPERTGHATDAREPGDLMNAGTPLAHQAFADLATALRATIPTDARVLGFGELHARVDRAQVRSSLAAFTEALPAFGDQISDLIVETWIVDPKCGKAAVQATKRVETEVKRPVATKSEISQLADAARATKIQPHAMTLTCKDYAAIAPEKGGADPIAMLTLTTRELRRIATSAVVHRDKQPDHRPWIAVYGGALHNDRFPAATIAEWSYAETVDLATDGHYVEIDLIVPELAEADQMSREQPWFPLTAAATKVLVWSRGERSFVVILPRTRS